MKHRTREVKVKGVRMVQCNRCLQRFGVSDPRLKDKCPGRPGKDS